MHRLAVQRLQQGLFCCIRRGDLLHAGAHLHRRARQVQLVQDVFSRHDELSPVLNQAVGALAGPRRQVARHGEHIPPLLRRDVRCQQCAAGFRRFNDYHTQRQSADRAIAHGEVLAFRRRAGRELRHQRAAFHNGGGQMAMLGRIDCIDPAAEHGDGAPTCVQCDLVRRRVNAQRHPADDGNPSVHQRLDQGLRHFAAIRRRAARADERHRPAIRVEQCALNIQYGRRIGKFTQQRRVVDVIQREGGCAQPVDVVAQLVQVNGFAGLQKIRCGAAIQPSGSQVMLGGIPGRFEIAKVGVQRAQPHRPNSLDYIEAEPVLPRAHCGSAPLLYPG